MFDKGEKGRHALPTFSGLFETWRDVPSVLSGVKAGGESHQCSKVDRYKKVLKISITFFTFDFLSLKEIYLKCFGSWILNV